MSHVGAVLAQLLHVVLVLAAAPLAMGFARRGAARLEGRTGPPVTQFCRDLLRLLRKQPVFSETASKPFESAPALAFAASLLAAALTPSFAVGMAAAPVADLIVIAGLLMLARTTLALAAMETGTALGGIGASRSMALAAFTEPALLLAALPLALLVGTTNLDVMAGVLREGTLGARTPLVLAVAALLVVVAARLRGTSVAAAVPLGEAAMAEEALAREFSGRHLALLQFGGALRQLAWMNLLADLAVPLGLAEASGSPLSWLGGVLSWVAKIGVLTLALVGWEAARAARRERLADVLGLALLLGLLAAMFLFAGQGFA